SRAYDYADYNPVVAVLLSNRLLPQAMEKKMIDEIKELLQSFLAPQLEGIRGDIRALDAKIASIDMKLESKIDALDMKVDALDMKLDAKIGSVDTKVESFRRELLAKIHRVEQTLSTNFVRLEQKVDLSLGAMIEKMDLFRREMLAEIKAASK